MVPDGWKIDILGNLFEFKNGLNAEKEQYGIGYKFVNVMDVFRNDILTEPKIIGRVQVSEKQLGDYKLKYGDVLFNRTSETFEEIAMAAVYLDNVVVTFGGFVIRGRPKTDKIYPDFSVSLFQASGYRTQAIKLGQGAVRANIGQKDLAKVSILVPPVREQKKIAQVLSTWVAAIDTTEQMLVNSQQQKKALMQQLLTGEKRLAGFNQAWNKVKVNEMGSISSGGTPDTTEREYWDGSISWLTPTDVTSLKSRYVFSTNRKITEKGLKNSSAKRLPNGALLICTRATIGAMAISTTEITTNQGFKNLVPNSDFSVEFLYYLLTFNVKELVRKSSGSTFLELSKADFGKLTFLCPCLDEQHKIASVLIAADDAIAVQQQKLNHLKQEKKALMQQLLTGKRRVKVDAA